ncbi:hypothetical protein [Archangium lansingense]|uniref:Outer membrane protein beta-barrel domain-containing protein n=1 Tax=Archangium lansingense TaxID=2995310 RepID=A0ABT4ANY7_9BACT|nr:hypothetical protein [Archangium lansinium]MCY1083306.1 hypothetical protein [Archangium lansinium]
MLTSAALLTSSLLLASGDSRASEDAERSSDGESAVRRTGALLDRSPQTRDHMISVFAFPSWYYGLGMGAAARYTLPIVHDGFIPSLNDSVELEFGGDIWFGGSGGFTYTALGIPAEGRWTFHITDRFDAYAKIGLGWVLAFTNTSGVNSVGGLYVTGGPGVAYRVADAVALRAEIGNFGLRAGVGFAF